MYICHYFNGVQPEQNVKIAPIGTSTETISDVVGSDGSESARVKLGAGLEPTRTLAGETRAGSRVEPKLELLVPNYYK